MQEAFLQHKLNERRNEHALRQLRLLEGKIDFCSNDYLGIATQGLVEKFLGDDPDRGRIRHGSGGSRLLAGNYPLIEDTEKFLARFHDAPAGLIFNSGYDANIGLLSAVPRRGDSIFYDYLSHASIRDGIRLSFAQSFAFAHNDLADLEKKLRLARGNIFVVTESVFSMDGDKPPLEEMLAVCNGYGAQLVVDEAHATGIIGEKGEGLVQELQLNAGCFARIHTFGKAVGCHGAVVLGSETLKEYLINFSRSFIYTTALPSSSVAAIRAAYDIFPQLKGERNHLQNLISKFQQATLPFERLPSETPIQVLVVPGNERIKILAHHLQENKLDVRPILYPTVPKGRERMRIVLHSFNSTEELDLLISCLSAEG
jgi:8-amino-7-oxononanoate synthase